MSETIITVVCTLAGFAFGLYGYKRMIKSDGSTQGQRDGAILTEIGYLK